MRVLGESWCFCNGGAKTERMKGTIFASRASAMAEVGGGTGFLIHRNLLLTTHVNLPSVAAAEAAEIRLQEGGPARLVPHRFFITSSVLDLTIVGLDAIEGDLNAQAQQPHYLKTCSNPSLNLGSVVYLLGHSERKELAVGEGKVVIATDNLIKLATDGVTWSPGSAGFDVQGNLAFMVCDPMKLATSPTAKSSSTSSSSTSSWKRDQHMQFGIPIPIICDWLSQHWEGSLDELSKPKLPLIRLMSTGQKSDHSCASFTQRRVFKPMEDQNDEYPTSSHIISRPRHQSGPCCSAASNVCREEACVADARSGTHEQGIPTPEIFESPRMTALTAQKKENTHIQLLDINFPPRIPKSIVIPTPSKQLPRKSHENVVEERHLHGPPVREEKPVSDERLASPCSDAEVVSVGSVNEAHSEVQSSSSPIGVSHAQHDVCGFDAEYSSEGETMYSAETMESKNYTSPREEKFQQVGRSQSCVSYNRWGATHRNPVARRTAVEKHRSFTQARRTYSHGATCQRGHDYYSPTVSSTMKRRNSSEPMNRPRQSSAHLSPRWI
ncbi:hypothetical protein Syun_006275 [Stephania yunnanensis]|uniref:Serine protease n=1 Tax=Stephania yunnanensis TaxID=152371 RepID=A0AAP0KXY4_9MAGN